MIAALTFYMYFLPKKYAEYVEKYAGECNLESELIYAVIKCESDFSEKAESKAGAIGLMQLMPETAEYIERLNNIEEKSDLYNASDNVRLGVLYLKYLTQRFTSLNAVLAAYNAGEGRVVSWLSDPRFSTDGEKLRVIPFKETARYVERVKKFYNYYKFFYF